MLMVIDIIKIINNNILATYYKNMVDSFSYGYGYG